jgi:predicted transcriptional regulator
MTNNRKFPILEECIFKYGISKKEIADLIGITGRALSNKLKGQSPITLREATDIKKTYFPDMEIEQLFATAQHEIK